MFLLLYAAGADYTSVNTELNFNFNSGLVRDNIRVAMVTILNDDILENDEQFRIVLDTSDPRVVISGNGNISTVTIVDDDSKQI